MTTPDFEPSDEIVSLATGALRSMPVTQGPSEAVLGRILADLHAASGPRPPVPARPRFASRATRSAVAAVVVTGLCALVVTWVLRPASAFAEVAQKFRDARTLVYRTTLQIAGQPEPIALRVLVKAPALIRCEVESAGTVTVIDGVGGRILVLDPKSRSALLLEGSAAADGRATNLAASQVEGLRNLAEARSEPVGRRRIGNVEAEGFRVGKAGEEVLVWVDLRARVPLRIELKTRINGVENPISLSNFQFDPSLDDRLFSFEPPAGYALYKGHNRARSDEEAIVDMLRSYAEHAQGRFPLQFADWSVYAQGLPETELRGEANAEAVRLIQNITRVQIFLNECEGDNGYRPEGVRLGDADKILFWYRRKGSTGYRAIFGDLHAADVTADQLPRKSGP
jgi:outer membrane lipoprotein-sorting protein